MTSAGMSKATGLPGCPAAPRPCSCCAGAPGRANEELGGVSAPSPARSMATAPRFTACAINQMLLWQQQRRAWDGWIALRVTDKWKSCECLNYCFRPFQTQKESAVSVISQKVSSQLLIPPCVLSVCLCIVCSIILMKVHLHWIQRILFRCCQPQCSRLWAGMKRSVIQFLSPVLMVMPYGMGLVKYKNWIGIFPFLI